jgi:hypothetical protein
MARPVMIADRGFQKCAMRCLRNTGVSLGGKKHTDDDVTEAIARAFAIVWCPEGSFWAAGSAKPVTAGARYIVLLLCCDLLSFKKQSRQQLFQP